MQKEHTHIRVISIEKNQDLPASSIALDIS